MDKMGGLKKYYYNQFFITFQSYSRQFGLGVCLQIIQIGWLFYFLLQEQTILKASNLEITSLEKITEVLDINDELKKEYCTPIFFICLSINVGIILLTFIDAVIYNYFSNLNHLTLIQSSNTFLQIILSLTLKIYAYAIYTPSFLISLYYANWLGYMNVLITILIGIFVHIHDFDYNLFQENNDSLSKYPLYLTWIAEKVFVSVIISNRVLYNQDVNNYLCLCYSIFTLLQQIIQREYHNKYIRQLKNTLLLLLCFASILWESIETNNFNLSVFLLLLVIFPPLIKISYLAQNFYSSLQFGYIHISERIQKKQISKLVYYIQDMVGEFSKFNSKEYSTNPHSQLLGSISSEHLEFCKIRNCFCSQDVKGNKELKLQQRNQHLIAHIDNLFKDILLTNKSKSKVPFYYINFLIKQAKSKAATLFQLQKLKHESKQTSFSFRLYYQYLTYKCKQEFQRESKNSLNETVGLDFEENLRIASQIYESSLYQKLELLSQLNNDHVNTAVVQKSAMDFYSSRTLLKNKISFLTQLNPLNEQLNIIRDGYNLNFCFVLNSENFQVSRMHHHIHQNVLIPSAVASVFNQNPFDKDQCVLFLSSEQGTLGKIIKAQKSFEDMFGIQDYIGKKIESVIPNIMVKEHDELMRGYLNNNGKQYESTANINLAIAKDSQNFGIGVKLRATIDHVSSFDSIGFVCNISLNYDYSNAALISKNTFSFQNVSKSFFSLFLDQTFHTNEIMQINAAKIIPQLAIPSFYQDITKKDFKDVLMILPAYSNSSLSNFDQQLTPKDYFKTSSISDKILKITEQEIFQNTSNFIFYLVQLQVYNFKNSEFPCFVITIKNSQKVKNLYELQPVIQQIQQQYAEVNQNSSSQENDSSHLNGYSTKLGNSEHLLLNNEMSSLIQLKSSQTQLHNFQKLTSRSKLINQDIHSQKLDEISSSKNDFRDSPMQSVTRRSHISGMNTPLEVSQSQDQFHQQNNVMSIFQDYPYTNRPLVKDQQQPMSSSRMNLEFELNKVLFSSPRNEEESLTHHSVAHNKPHPKLFDKYLKGSPNTNHIHTSEKSQQKQNRLSSDIIKRLKAFQEQKGSEHSEKKKFNENLQKSPQQFAHFSKSQTGLQNSQHPSLYKSTKHQNQSDVNENFNQSMKEVPPNEENEQPSNIKDQQQFLHCQSEQTERQASFTEQKEEQSSNQAEMGKKINYQQSSLQSSSGSTKEALKQIERKIMVLQSSLGLKILNAFGLISVISISLAIILQGLQITLAFEKAAIDFNFVSWPMDISSSMSQLQYQTAAYFINVLQLIPTMTKRWPTYKTDCLTSMSTLNQEWTLLWMDQVNSDQKLTPYFYDTLNRDITWKVNRDKFSYKAQQITFNTSEFYFVQNYLSAYKTYLILLKDDFNQQAILIENYQDYFAQANRLKEDIKAASIESLESILDNARLLMILCIVLSLCVIISIFPIYSYLQLQNEEIFRLMATINANSLIYMSKQAVSSLTNFQSALSQYKHISKAGSTPSNQSSTYQLFSDNQKQFILKTLEKPNKKKNISSHEPLSKFSFNLLIITVGVFFLIVLLPIISYFIIDNFKQESILNVKVLNSLYDLKNSLSYTLYISLGAVFYNLDSTTLYKGEFFQMRAVEIFADNQVKISNVFQIISESNAQKRFDNDDYQNFFYKILNKDVCSALVDYPQFSHQDKYPIDESLCKSIRGGIMQKGYQTAAKYYFESLQSIFDFIETIPKGQAKQYVPEWEQKFDIPNFDKFFKIMLKTITILKEFMKEKGDKYLNTMKISQDLISVFEILILLIVFLFWWIVFYKRMQNEINQNRRLLSLIDVQVIMENTYIIAFLSKIKII